MNNGIKYTPMKPQNDFTLYEGSMSCPFKNGETPKEAEERRKQLDRKKRESEEKSGLTDFLKRMGV